MLSILAGIIIFAVWNVTFKPQNQNQYEEKDNWSFMSYPRQSLELKLKTPEKQDNMTEIASIAKNVSDSNTYIRAYPKIFDCTDFSRELVRQYGEKGYNATCIFGMLVERTFIINSTFIKRIPHTWVALYFENKTYFIEATGGFIIPEDSYKIDYEERVRGKCI